MVLKSLELQGFKSFPDRTLIRFGEDITAIVGPNGSGKSNISDAVLWVLGEQSTRTLRGTKMEDVIFSGTEKRPAVGFAEATLTLDNADRALLRDADEVMVTRRFYRSGDSEYYINRQSARLRDIHELFMDTGLGREGYANIGQGRIDEILSVKSTDRREIFEEAAGISKYRHRKEETERRLAVTEDNLLRIGDKVSELELQIAPLREQSEKAQQYLALKEELQGVEVAVWLQNLAGLTAAAKKAEEDYASASFVLQQAHEELDSLYRRSDASAQALREQEGLLETARQQVSLLEGAGQQLAGQIAVLQGNAANHRSNARRIREELESQSERSGGITVQAQQSRSRVAAIDGELEQGRQALETVSGQLTALTANAQGLTRQFLEKRAQETALTAQLAGQEADIHGLQASLEQTRERLEHLEEDLTAGEGRRTQAEAEMARCRGELRQAREAAQTARNTIAGYALRQQTRLARRDELQNTLRTLTAEQEGVAAKVRVYRAMERDYESYQKSVRLVMQEAERGRLEHIHGPVSRLIRTDDRYTVAIEIALGGAMQYLVVDTEQDGKAAIAHLKRTAGGRATFLPLSTIRGRELQEQGLEDCPGFVNLASRLVRCEEPYRQVVDNLLGRIVIAENLDSAIGMAKQYRNRFKIVTLDGQVMNPGGSMTGGSVNREAGILSRANELERLQQRLQTLEQQRLTTDEELREAQRSLDEVAFQTTGAQEQLRQAEDQVLRLEGEEKQHEILLNAIGESMASAAEEREHLLQRRQTEGERLASQQGKHQACTEQLTRLRRSLAELEGSQSEAARASEDLNEQLTARKTSLAALEAERETALDHIRDLEALQQSLEGDREKKQSMVDAMEAEAARIEAEMAALEQKRAENCGLIARQKEKLQQILTRRASVEAEKTRLERLSQEKNRDILNMERACALLEQKKVTTAMEERQIIDKLWESYGLTPTTAPAHAAQVESAAAGNRRAGELRRRLTALGTPNLGAIEEYARVSERYTYLTAQRDDVLTSKRELESIIRSITREMTSIFTTEFEKINRYFGQTFEEMFGGGKGQLLLEDPEDPLGCGIEIRVQPPGKQVKTITLLSGGEKAFVAIALYFAILKVRPTPFCILDEIDAALDDRNVERYASYLRGLSGKTQFIVITHRRGTMEAADVLYGVTMQEQGVSKLLRLDLNQMESQLGILE